MCQNVTTSEFNYLKNMEHQKIFQLLKLNFNLNQDMDDEKTIIESIRSGAEFRGANLWVLILAIFIASIGLNMNSTAVIIGAMLISPLMGPLIAIGLGLAINDFDLIKKSLINLSFAVFASLMSSTFYFLLSPISIAQSEILSRTSPTIFDVFIALAGGLAGMIGSTRKTKSNVLPGVAIATALMPPLCTAGYGLAKGNWQFFFGAFYLFFINCVFIFLGTFIVVKIIHFQKINYIYKQTEKKIRSYIIFIISVTVIPSVFFAYEMVQITLLKTKIDDFISREISARGIVVVGRKDNSIKDKKTIELSVFGENIDQRMKTDLKHKLKSYGLEDVNIKLVNVGSSDKDIVAIKTEIVQDLFKNNEQLLKEKDIQIEELKRDLLSLRALDLSLDLLKDELSILNSNVENLILSKVLNKNKEKTVLIGVVKSNKAMSKMERDKVDKWLKLRTQSDEVKVLYQFD